VYSLPDFAPLWVMRIIGAPANPPLTLPSLARNSSITVRLNALFSNVKDSGSLLRAFIYVGANDLSFKVAPDGSHDAAFEIESVLFGDNGIPLEQTRANLQSIIDQVKARNPNASIVIVGIQFPIAAPDSEYASAFVKMFGELAAKNHAALVPSLLEGVAGDPKLNLPDCIHPNAAGHKILVENVWRVLEPIAREVGSK